jgi:(R,R)-butanediol dehydrogenase/meso-butanediol dehydrogenase/diacetyl reductase
MIHPSAHPLSGQAPPVTLGHELVGTLVEGQSPDGAIQPGARVTVDACLRCGTCAACVRGQYHRCRYGGSIGLHTDGGFARSVAVPSSCLVAVPDGVSDEQAALSEPFAVGLHALDRGGVRAGDVVVVLGFGPIGAAAALVARALGATPMVVERDDARLQTAQRLGLATIDAGDDLRRAVRAATAGAGADVLVECTGVAALVAPAIECVARGGTIVLAGLPADPVQIDPRRLTLFERTLTGSLGYVHDLPRVLALVDGGRLDPAQVVGETVDLDEAPAAFERMAAGTSASIKTLVAVGAAVAGRGQAR